MEQHAVPQHIASFEFKLFGNLTIRQFVTLAIPMSLAALIFFSDLPPVIRLPISGLIALFALFAALVPINGRPLDKWFVIFVRAILSPTQRIWVKEAKIPEFLNIVTEAVPTHEHPGETMTVEGRERLLAYLRSLPRGSTSSLDAREQMALERLEMTWGGTTGQVKEGGRLPPAISWAGQLPAAASLPQVGPLAAGVPTTLVPQVGPTSPKPAVAGHAKPYILPGVEQKLTGTAEMPMEVVTYLDQGTKLETEVTSPRKLAAEINFSQDVIIPIQTPDRHLKLLAGIGKTRVRKLHFGPPEGFDLSKLPIRGEKRFEISEQLKRLFHINSQLVQQNTPAAPPPQPVVKPIVQSPPIEQRKPRRGRPPGSSLKSTLLKPTGVLQGTNVTFKQPKKEISDSKLTVGGQKLTGMVMSEEQLKRAQILPLTNKQNILSGQVTSRDGMPIEGAILIVRDVNGIPVRALKTNKLGQFLSATVLPNGQYMVEVEGDTYKFEPFSIEINNQVVAPLSIVARE